MLKKTLKICLPAYKCCMKVIASMNSTKRKMKEEEIDFKETNKFNCKKDF